MKEVSYDILKLHKHNIDSYEIIKNTFLSDERFCAIVHATGTGKTFNALQLILENPDKKFAYVTPYTSIIEHISNIMREVTEEHGITFDNVEFYTYAGISRMSTKELSEIEMDYLILDEFHHIGAPLWGEKIEKLIELHPLAKVLGISAYTVRDRGSIYERDMASDDGSEIFSNKVVSRYDLVDAMIDGVLPKPIYRSYHANMHNFINDLEELVNKNNPTEVEYYNLILEKLNATKKLVYKNNTAKNLFLNNIKKDGKYIYFCPLSYIENVNDVDSIMREVKCWLLEVGYKEEDFILYSTTSKDEDGYKKREAFYYDQDLNGNDVSHKLKIMFAINQYNEGIHAPNIDGVILGRETESDIVFFEQIGRALSVRGFIYDDNNEPISPVIIDLADNMEYIMELENSYNSKLRRRDEVTDRINIKDDNLYTESFDIDVMYHNLFIELTQLKERLQNYTWDDSYKLAVNYYNKYGDLDIPRNFRTDNGVDYNLYGYRLGEWIAKMRSSKDNLLQYKIDKLNEIGMIWKKYYTWDEIYELLVKFNQEYGIDNLYVSTIYEDYNLGDWLNNQRSFYRRGLLDKKKIDKLNKLNIKWNCLNTWEESYILLLHYYLKNHHVNIPWGYKTEEGYGLYDWLRNQKTAYNEGKLSEEQIFKLRNLGVSFDNARVAKRSYSILEYRIILEEYFKTGAKKAKRGKLFKSVIFNEEIDVARIIDRIKRKYDEGKLSLDDITYYQGLGLELESKIVHKTWDESYLCAKEYFDTYGHLYVPAKYKTNDGYDLGNWIYLMRKNKDKLNVFQINKLNSIDMVWVVNPERKKVMDMVEVNNISYKSNKVIIDAISLFELKAKIRYLVKNGIEICDEEELHMIFRVSNEELVNLIGMDYHTLLIKYLPKKDKESYVKSLQK